MPEEIEIETSELQETIDELHHERAEREIEAKQNSWTRYIAMTTALLAVFAAIGALQGGAKVNEAMIDQIKAADKWNEYQAARQKEHIYTLKANDLLDAGAKLPEIKEGAETPSGETPKAESHAKAEAHPSQPKEHEKASLKKSGEVKKPKSWKSLAPDKRLAQYLAKVKDETDKEEKLKEEAQELEKESNVEMHHHHRFAYAVAMIQVAIALSAIAALTRIKPVWLFSTVIGAFGIVMFFMGMLGK